MVVNGAPDAGRGGLKQLALRERHEALGARFAPFAGWEMPLQYEGIVSEHEAVRGGVGVFDVSHLARAWVRGPGAAELLRSVTTFDVTTVPVGKAHYSLYCNEQGGIEDDVFIYHLPDDQWLVIHNAANADADYLRLWRVAGDQASEETPQTALLAVQGPGAVELLTKVLGAGFAALEARDCAELDWGGVPVLVARTGYTGEDGGECIVGADDAAVFWDALIDGGATPAGLGARDTLRLEAALPLHGNDIDATTHPFESGLGFAVTLDDEVPFTGRDALAKAKAQPRTRRLAHLVAQERGVIRAGYGVHLTDEDGEMLGDPLTTLTSGAFSPSLRVGIGMAYLPAQLARPGVRLAVDVRGRALPVEVVRRPFYRKQDQS